MTTTTDHERRRRGRIAAENLAIGEANEASAFLLGYALSCLARLDPDAYRDALRAATVARLEKRRPYVNHGINGARASAQIDREEADTLPTGPHQPGYSEAVEEHRDRLLSSAAAWDEQADGLDEALTRLDALLEEASA